MTDSPELEKQRDIVFSEDPPGQPDRAYQLLSGLPNFQVEYGDIPNALRVTYSLEHYTLEGLEHALTEEGFHLDHSMLRGIERNVIYYSEDTICHNMDIPMQFTKKKIREIFVKAYDHEPHGDHDDTPPELRDYK
ncbi:MAG: hypothetical protein ACOY9D_05525 [Pseudomonadota bacterium]